MIYTLKRYSRGAVGSGLYMGLQPIALQSTVDLGGLSLTSRTGRVHQCLILFKELEYPKPEGTSLWGALYVGCWIPGSPDLPSLELGSGDLR